MQHDIRQELQKKRDEFLGETRRKKIEEIFAKKRNVALARNGKLYKISEENAELLEEWCNRTYTLKDLPQLLNAINSNEVLQWHFGAIGIRRLAAKDDPPIQEIIDVNAIPPLIAFTERYEHPQLQYEAAWALANLASGTTLQTQSIIDNGGITALVRLLKHENHKISEQAIWAIGNIAGDNIDFRDQILKANALPPLMDIICKSESLDVIRNGTWALSNLARGSPLPKFELVKDTIPTFSKVIQQIDDIETLVDAAWAMCHLSDGRQNNQVSLILATGICPSLIAHIRMDQRIALLVPLLRTLGNLFSGSDEQAGEILKVPNVVDKLVELATTHENRTVIREACWCLSNITAGGPEQIQMVMKNHEQIVNLMKLHERPEPEVVKEVLWIFANATAKATPTQMMTLFECNIIDLFYKDLNNEDSEYIKIALDGVTNVLNMGAFIAHQNNTDNQFLIKFEEKDGVRLLEDLQRHPSHEIYEKAIKILETHYESESI